MGVVGAALDGLNGDFKLMAVKALMDGLAVMTFARVYGWFALASVVPVFALFGTVTLGVRALDAAAAYPSLYDGIGAMCGMLALAVAMVIIGAKKVYLADCLPALIVGPALFWFFA
jgi:uncharacterized membrane protein YqgA involved in biofilm formation